MSEWTAEDQRRADALKEALEKADAKKAAEIIEAAKKMGPSYDAKQEGKK